MPRIHVDRVSALILAAGLSSRVGRFKPLLPRGKICAVERAINTFRSAGVTAVGVVDGHGREARRLLKEAFARRRASDTTIHPIFNTQRGHPPLIPGGLILAILGHNGPGGLRAVLEAPDACGRKTQLDEVS